jgi:hypothetical protein
MSHPPVVDVATSKAHFNHDIFQAVLATDTGARALVIEMDHVQHGPLSFVLIGHAWKDDVRVARKCTGLKLVLPQ